MSSLSGRAFPAPSVEGAGLTVRVEAISPSSYTLHLSSTVAAVGDGTAPIVVRGQNADGTAFEVRAAAHWYGVSP